MLRSQRRNKTDMDLLSWVPKPSEEERHKQLNFKNWLHFMISVAKKINSGGHRNYFSWEYQNLFSRKRSLSLFLKDDW